MVLREVMEKVHVRLENLIAYELALEQQGKTIYDVRVGRRARIHLDYKLNSSFWWDVNVLVELGLLPENKSRKELAVGGLLKQIDELVAEGVDIFAMNRTKLAESLGMWHTSLRCHIPELAQALEAKYGKRLGAMQSVHDGHIKTDTTEAYERIMAGSPQFLPAASELAGLLGCLRATIVSRCERYGLELSKAKRKPAAIKLWREILNLENKLASNNMHVFSLPNEELKKYFSDYRAARLRKKFGGIYKYMQWRLNYLAKSGRILTGEAKEVRKLLDAFDNSLYKSPQADFT